jgi:hypothetical protein
MLLQNHSSEINNWKHRHLKHHSKSNFEIQTINSYVVRAMKSERKCNSNKLTN